MFGSRKQQIDTDKLPIFVHIVQSNEAFGLAQKIWNENGRLLHFDQANRKEFISFVYNKPGCTVWLERDQGRLDMFELILVWNNKDASEVYVLSPQTGQNKVGDDSRAITTLQAILTTPSIVPAT